jgi:hypothetical protein
MRKKGNMMRCILVSGMLAATACSVKEIRGECPCYLQVTFAETETRGEARLLGWREPAALFRETVRIEDCTPWVHPVEKGFLTVAACKGIRESILETHRVGIPAGREADSLYAGFAEVDATGEIARAEIALRKQFATVFLDIRKKASELKDYAFRVEGNTSGFDLLDYSPVPGLFRCEPKARDGESIVTFRLPRQADDSLTVTVRAGEGVPATFPLGKYIAALGYNWKTEELQDIYVAIDLVNGLVDLRVADWEEGMVFPLVEI